VLDEMIELDELRPSAGHLGGRFHPWRSSHVAVAVRTAPTRVEQSDRGPMTDGWRDLLVLHRYLGAVVRRRA
jgi:hypothetical protein